MRGPEPPAHGLPATTHTLTPLTPSYGLIIEAGAGDDLMDISLARLSELLKSRAGGALLFRNFKVSQAKFKEFTDARGTNFVVHHNLAQRDYVEDDKTFATVNKGKAAIGFHNEMSVSPLSPDVFWMHCEAPSRTRGKTGIADGVGVALSLTGPTRKFFAEKKFVIKKSFAKDDWIACFNGDRARVESWLESVGRRRGIVEFAFAPESETLTYTYAFPAVRPARLSSCEVWCCGMLDNPESYSKMEGGVPPPRHMFMEATHAVYQNACWIDWQPNDVLVVDNTRFMHSREAFEGEGRRILVRYSDLKEWPEVAPRGVPVSRLILGPKPDARLTMDDKSPERKPFLGRNTHFSEYGEALRRHYPDIVTAWLDVPPVPIGSGKKEGETLPPVRGQRPAQRQVAAFKSSIDEAVFDGRFEDPNQRKWEAVWPQYRRSPKWTVPGYKGLLRMKLPTDLMLYSHLIWELQPRTIIEFGSLQGGSGLWFADQLAALEGHAGHVYSIDYLTKCVHPTAKQHPILTFLTADLHDLKTIDAEILRTALHPWLVVEDAHVNIFGLFSFLDKYLVSGDYYTIEDEFMIHCKKKPDERFLKRYEMISELGYLVDTHYTDGFGYNATCAPNAWLRKS